jgi:hypothetical protein
LSMDGGPSYEHHQKKYAQGPASDHDDDLSNSLICDLLHDTVTCKTWWRGRL